MKKTFTKSIAEITNISNRMPKSINEAINFESDEMDNEPIDEPSEEPAEVPSEAPAGPVSIQSEGEADIDGFIANMRKESLGIMKALAEDPDNAVYQFAKKIFQLADKAHEDQKEGKDINGQPKQGQMMQQ